MQDPEWQDHIRTQEDDLVRQLLEANNVDDVIARMEKDHYRHIRPVMQNLTSFDTREPQAPAPRHPTEHRDSPRHQQQQPEQPGHRGAGRGAGLQVGDRVPYSYSSPAQEDPPLPAHRPESPTLSGRGLPSVGSRPLSPSASEGGQSFAPLSRSHSYSKYLHRPYRQSDADEVASHTGSRYSTAGPRRTPPPPPPPPPPPQQESFHGNSHHHDPYDAHQSRDAQLPRSPRESYRRPAHGTPTSVSLSHEAFPEDDASARHRPGSAYGRVAAATPRSDALKTWEPADAALSPRVTTSVPSPALAHGGGLDDPAQSRIARQLQLLRNYRELAELCSQTDNPAYNLFASIPPEQLARVQAEQLRKQLADGTTREQSPVMVSNNYYFSSPPPPHANTETPDTTTLGRSGRPRFNSILGSGGNAADGTVTSTPSPIAHDSLRARRPPGLSNLVSRPPLQSPQASSGPDSPLAVNPVTPANERSTGPYLSPAPSPPSPGSTPTAYGAIDVPQLSSQQPAAVRSPRSKSHRANHRGNNTNGFDDDVPTATTEEAGTSYGEEDDDFQGDFLDDEDAFFYQQQPPRIIEREQHRRFNTSNQPLPGTSNVTLNQQFGVSGHSGYGDAGGTTNTNSASSAANTMANNNAGNNSNSNSNNNNNNNNINTGTAGGNSGSYGAQPGSAAGADPFDASGAARSPSAAGGRSSKGASVINVISGEKELIADANTSHSRATTFPAMGSPQSGGGGGGGGGDVGGGQGHGSGGGDNTPSPKREGYAKKTPEKRFAVGDDDTLDSDMDGSPFNEQLQTHNPSASAARKRRVEQEQRRRQQRDAGRYNTGNVRGDRPGGNANRPRHSGRDGRSRYESDRRYRGGRQPRYRDDMYDDDNSSYDYSYSYSSSTESSLAGNRFRPLHSSNMRSGTRPATHSASNRNRGEANISSGRRTPSPGGRGRGGAGRPMYNNNNHSGRPVMSGNGNSPGRGLVGRGGRGAGGAPGPNGGRPAGPNGSPQRMPQHGQQLSPRQQSPYGGRGMSPQGRGRGQGGVGGGRGAGAGGPMQRPMMGSGKSRIVTLPDGRRVAVPMHPNAAGGNGVSPGRYPRHPGPMTNTYGDGSMDASRQNAAYPTDPTAMRQGGGQVAPPGGGILVNTSASDRGYPAQPPHNLTASALGQHQQRQSQAPHHASVSFQPRPGSVAPSVTPSMGTRRGGQSPPRIHPGLLYGSLLPKSRAKTALVIAPDEQGHIRPGGIDQHDGSILPLDTSGVNDDDVYFPAATPTAADGAHPAAAAPMQTSAVVGDGREVQPLVWKSGSSGMVVGRNHRVPTRPTVKLSSHYRKPDSPPPAPPLTGFASTNSQAGGNPPYAKSNVQRVLPLDQPMASATRNDQQRQFEEQQQRQRQFLQQQRAIEQQQQQMAASGHRHPAAVAAAAGLNPNQARYSGVVPDERRGSASSMAQANAQRFGIAPLSA